MSTGEMIFWGTVGFFALLAVLVFLRLMLRKSAPEWKQLRLGVYIERVPSEDYEDEEVVLFEATPKKGPL